MKAVELWIINYLLNSLWQIPLLFTAAWLVARQLKPVGPRFVHRVWAVGLVLEVLLPGCRLQPGALNGLLRQASDWLHWGWSGAPADGQVHVTVAEGSGTADGLLRLSGTWLPAMVAVYGCVALFFTGRLTWALWKTCRMQAQTKPLRASGPFLELFQSLCSRFGLDAGRIEVATSSSISGPVTIGIWRQALLVPPEFLESISEVDLAAVLAHELAHMRRMDFAKNLAYGALSLPVAWHPLLWLTRSRLAESREMVCDGMAAEVVDGPESYARSLLRLAATLSLRPLVPSLHAIGIFDANTLERRVMHLTRKHRQLTTFRRVTIAAVCLTAFGTACVSAMALRLNLAGESTATTPSIAPDKLHVKVDQLKQLSKVQPVYPPDAKKAGIQGTVLLDAVIGKDGHIQDIQVQKGPKELQESSIDAVKKWSWEPYLLNGDPIEVETTITVIYTLGN